MRRTIKVGALVASVTWAVSVERRLQAQQRAVDSLPLLIEKKISEHRDSSPHGIALIGQPTLPDFEPPKLDEHIWSPPSAQQYFGVPIYDPANIIKATLAE